MKTLLICVLLAHCISLVAQQSFDYHRDFKSILQQTLDPNSELSYDKLLKRFKANDTTLTDHEVLALLIGYTAKPEYKPYSDIAKEREVYRLADEAKFQAAIDTANRFLSKHPLGQQAIYEKSYCFYKLKMSDSSDYFQYQFDRIMMAMDYSGDGKEVPMFALGPADGQNYIKKYLHAKIGFMGSGSDKNGYFIDILHAQYKDGTSEPLNFVIQHATDKMFSEEDLQKMLKEIDKKKDDNKEKNE